MDINTDVAALWVILVSIVSVIFALGAAWSRLGTLERDLRAHMAHEDSRHKAEDGRWETMQEWMRAIEQELGNLKGRLAQPR